MSSIRHHYVIITSSLHRRSTSEVLAVRDVAVGGAAAASEGINSSKQTNIKETTSLTEPINHPHERGGVASTVKAGLETVRAGLALYGAARALLAGVRLLSELLRGAREAAVAKHHAVRGGAGGGGIRFRALLQEVRVLLRVDLAPAVRTAGK
eukprot:1194647-Prorocentrum_minimum.AAC.1